MFMDSILNICLKMTAYAQNTVKAKQVDNFCCSWETEKSFPIFAGNIYCLGLPAHFVFHFATDN